ncbi:MAG: tRNA 4-thiouridine(8) synthase ThiI, partial [Halobacteriota archaeon]
PIIPVYVDLGAFGGPDHQARALEAIARLDGLAGAERRSTYLVPGGEAVSRFVETIDRGRMLVLRRFMFRVADRIAAEHGAVGIVTGEALGQKSSQTAANLAATSTVTDRPIHRPLLTFDKVEITDEARALGTYRSATLPAGCPSVAPDQVETRGTSDAVDELEPSDIEELVERAVEAADIVPPARLDSYGRVAAVDP